MVARCLEYVFELDRSCIYIYIYSTMDTFITTLQLVGNCKPYLYKRQRKRASSTPVCVPSLVVITAKV
jgi:hypothetical protein